MELWHQPLLVLHYTQLQSMSILLSDQMFQRTTPSLDHPIHLIEYPSQIVQRAPLTHLLSLLAPQILGIKRAFLLLQLSLLTFDQTCQKNNQTTASTNN